MKIRAGFVSNSSSSSFIIKKQNISVKQLDLIKDHIAHGQQFGLYQTGPEDEWSIKETEDSITGDTFMDNFDMRLYLDAIGVAEEHVEWGDCDDDW